MKNNYELIHDDCFHAMSEMNDDSVDAIITDPPYGVLKHKIETEVDIECFIKECYRVLKPDSFLVYFGQQPTITKWNHEAFKLFEYKNEIIWYKRVVSSPMGDMTRVFENIQIVRKGKCKFNNTKLAFSDVQNSLAEFINVNTFKGYLSLLKTILNDTKKIELLIKEKMGGYIYTKKHMINDVSSVESFKDKLNFLTKYNTVKNGYKARNLVSFMPHNKLKNDMSRKGGGDFNVKHPTVKPIALLKYLIELTTKESDVILDPFVGSGTTILAGLETNRKVIGIELHQQYHDIAQQRIKSHINSGDSQQVLTI